MRNAPLLEVAPDMVVPLGVFLLGERGVNLPRLVVGKSPGSGGAREVNGLLGKCFEARIRDLAVSSRPRHHVITGAEIDDVVPAGDQRCDAIIASGDHWLLVESGLQTLPTRFGQGHVETIQDKCSAYLEKAQQADNMAVHLRAIARRYSMIPARTYTSIVVSESTVFTVPLADELSRQNRGRNPLFVVSLAEFEWLVASTDKWSIPNMVRSWQEKRRLVPLLHHMWELGQIAPLSVPGPNHDLAYWVGLMGTALAA